MASLRTSWVVVVALAMAGCQRNPGDSKPVPGSDSTAKAGAVAADSNLTDAPQGVVKDPAQYSKAFLAKLDWATDGKRYVLDKGVLVMEGSDTVRLPTAPSIGKTLRLERDHEGMVLRLDVTRRNWTAMDYRLELVKSGASKVETGSAEIPASFFLGAESDDSETSGEAYFVDEYTDRRPDDCTISLRLGRESESDGAFLGRVVLNCPSLGWPDLSAFPTLLQK